MEKEEFNEKMNKISDSMKKLGEKIKDGADTAAIAGMYAKDALSEKMKDAQSGLEAAKEQYRIVSARGKSKVSSQLLKAQMELDVAKENMQQKKEAKDKEKLAKYIDELLEYSEQCAALSVFVAEEAKLAFLEAVEAQQEYDEKYGEEK